MEIETGTILNVQKDNSHKSETNYKRKTKCFAIYKENIIQRNAKENIQLEALHLRDDFHKSNVKIEKYLPSV